MRLMPLCRLARKILSIYDDPTSDFQVEKKADNSPLTIADRKAHETICRFLADTPFPLLSEEGKHLPFRNDGVGKLYGL